ncbi:hypothetical protein NOR53_2512 [gamma proteobacterium NOR5-3]|nr:hypothetical protein NOR53_2512 [gamma proteobacterium NOR5-3]
MQNQTEDDRTQIVDPWVKQAENRLRIPESAQLITAISFTSNGIVEMTFRSNG